MKHKLRSLDARTLTELCLVRSTLHVLQPVVPQVYAETLERDIRAIDMLIPKLRERKRV